MTEKKFIKMVNECGGFGVAKIWNRMFEGPVTPLTLHLTEQYGFIALYKNKIGVYYYSNPLEQFNSNYFNPCTEWMPYIEKKKKKVAPYEYWFEDEEDLSINYKITSKCYIDDNSFLSKNAWNKSIIKWRRLIDKEVIL